MTTTVGYNVDGLAACSGQVVATMSNFVGRYWTGGIAVFSRAPDSGALQMQTLLEQRAGVPSLAVLPVADEFTGRRVVASGSDDGSVDLWYLSSSSSNGSTATDGPLLQHTQAKVLHDDAVHGLAAAPSSNQLASASADGSLRLWDCSQLLACTAQLGSGHGGAAAVHAVSWTADPSVLASASADGRLCLWDARQLGSSPSAVAAVGAPALSVVAAAPAAGQQLLVVGDELGRLTLFDPRNCSQPLQQQQLHGDAVHGLAASTGGSGNGSMVASGSDDGSIMLLDCGSLQASRQLVSARQEGEAHCYVRSLTWAGNSSSQQLYRGGWDQAVAAVPL